MMMGLRPWTWPRPSLRSTALYLALWLALVAVILFAYDHNGLFRSFVDGTPLIQCWRPAHPAAKCLSPALNVPGPGRSPG
jgi:hypothetical protein